MKDEEQQGFLTAIAEAPDEPANRLVYADWLAEQCLDAEACLQRYLAELPPEVRGDVIVFRRSGVLAESMAAWRRLEQPERERLSERVQENFENPGYVQVIAVSNLSLAESRFREVARSPILLWERGSGRVRDVVPVGLSKQQEEDLIALAQGSAKAEGAPGGSRTWRELAAPEWDVGGAEPG